MQLLGVMLDLTDPGQWSCKQVPLAIVGWMSTCVVQTFSNVNV